MRQQTIAELAGVPQCYVSRYLKRENIPQEMEIRIKSVLQISKTQMVLDWLKTGNTITPQQSLAWFGLHALSQTITKLRARGYNIQNIAGRGRDGHQHAIYILIGESK